MSISFSKMFPLALGLMAIIGCGSPEADPHASRTVNSSSKALPDQVITEQVMDVGCGQCKFGLKGEGCHLAIKVGDAAGFVDDVDMGDPAKMHEPGGYCLTVRKAKVSGEVVNHRFKATSYELLPLETDHKF